MRLRIFIVTSDRLELLKDCCRSVARALTPECRVTVLINGTHRATEEWLRQFNHPAFDWSSIEKECRAAARNRAFESHKEDIIHFLDDDVIVPSHLFALVLQTFAKNPSLSILGGPNLTSPGESWAGKLFGAVMTSFFAAPGVRVRYGAVRRHPKRAATERELILCNLAVRRRSIPSQMRFKRNLRSNEENLLLYECAKIELRAEFLSEAYVYHRRRRSVSSFARQVFSYGFGRGQQTAAAPKSCHPTFLVPPSCALLLIGALLFDEVRIFLTWLFSIYVLAAFAAAVESASIRALGAVGILLTVPLTALTHVAYGLGFWAGIIHDFRARNGRRRPPRTEPSPAVPDFLSAGDRPEGIRRKR